MYRIRSRCTVRILQVSLSHHIPVYAVGCARLMGYSSNLSSDSFGCDDDDNENVLLKGKGQEELGEGWSDCGTPLTELRPLQRLFLRDLAWEKPPNTVGVLNKKTSK